MSMYQWATDLWSMPRSLTGPGVSQTLDYLSALIPGLERHSVASGSHIYDWIAPDEYILRSAYLETMDGRRLVDFENNNLHVLGYSDPINALVSKAELQEHLYSLPNQPDAIPYITSYYKGRWGFCVTQRQRDALDCGPFRVVIDSEKKKGVMEYADIVIPGKSEREIMFSTYICHPSMANDNLSGIVVTAALARWIQSQAHAGLLHYTYRFVFVPETIGAIAYIEKNLKHLRRHLTAGYVLTCCGDREDLSYLPAPHGGYVNEVVLAAAKRLQLTVYDWSERGSDERQYCWPGVNLPVGSIMRTKYGCYPEYHTSLDNLSFISQEALDDTLWFIKDVITTFEFDRELRVTTTMCEPFLSKHGLYPDTSPSRMPDMLAVAAQCDGYTNVPDISDATGLDARQVIEIMKKLEAADVIRRVPT